jgi:hypothetical protein
MRTSYYLYWNFLVLSLLGTWLGPFVTNLCFRWRIRFHLYPCACGSLLLLSHISRSYTHALTHKHTLQSFQICHLVWRRDRFFLCQLGCQIQSNSGINKPIVYTPYTLSLSEQRTWSEHMHCMPASYTKSVLHATIATCGIHIGSASVPEDACVKNDCIIEWEYSGINWKC